ncbi:MAG: ADP-heptose synthase [Alphaproteobacteria bacterium]|nr:MAG: ADP-heptose synthase [Alphaproteobacteria bacterium]
MDSATRKQLGRKIKTLDELYSIIGPRPREKKVIMCHGTFDVVHPGHLRHLMYAKSKADILIASLTADAHIAKAHFRPYVPQDLRALNLAAFEIVDYVIIDPNPTPLEHLRILQPDYFAKGYEYANGGLHPKTQEEVAVLESYGGEMIFTPGDVVYSSSHLIDLAPPDIRTEKLMMLLDGEGLSFRDLYECLPRLSGLKVHVVGDTIVDTLTNCTMIGGITKTPTISVRFGNKEDFVGGAGIVAKHLRAAGADVTFTTVLGDDAYRDFVLDDLRSFGVNVNAIIDETRPTTNKNAIVAGGYRLLKVDTLDNRSISDKIVERFCNDIAAHKSDVVVFSDFRHGIFNRHTISPMIEAIPSAALRVADSQVASRWGNILEFQGFDLITPNEREARFALGDQDSVVRPLATELHRRAHCKTLILKLGDRGILTYRTRPEGDPRTFFVIDSFAGHVRDAVGAGDALLAYAALTLAATGNEVLASVIGSMAAGIECEFDGNQPVTPDNVHKKISDIEREANYG